MVMFVQGDSATFNSLVYGAQKHPGTMAFLENQVQQFTGALTEFGQQFVQSAAGLFNTFNGSEAMRIARAAHRKLDSLFMSDTIQSIWDIGRMQHAPLAMQRWIMAEPTTRRLYHQQRIDGFSETYVDMEPGRVGEDHYDYRLLMNGVLQDTEDGGWMVRHYLDDLHAGDVEPAFDQKVDIFDTFANLRAYIEAGKEDPTSKWNEKM
ncbi:hypothetical protein [Paraburkholderia sp. BCC1886]|uniref:hypothetical protein n=1 Tax=Paraburkholderia sp. BCC1886 TaxID=2562670 RepID=UPI0011828F44|nr:hypothetical protein [Paraburkholderia sp. BCC1886]